MRGASCKNQGLVHRGGLRYAKTVKTLIPPGAGTGGQSGLIRFLALLVFMAALATLRAQPDYANAHWDPPDCVKYYPSGNGHLFCVIHDMEGYYEASITLLNTCGTNEDFASVYYLVEGLTDQNDPAPPGDVTQSVSEQDYAWHVLCWNKWMFGTEHEGFVSNPAWYTPQEYQASASIQRHLCVNYGIPIDRNHIIGHNEWQNPVWTNWMAINYPQIDTTCNNHTDPGPYWNWTYLMDLISGSNGMSGTFWDAPGLGGVGSGTWDNFTTNWNPVANGTAPRGTWVGANTAFFCAGTSFAPAYTVTISQTQCVAGVVITNGNPTFTGGGLAFEGTNAYYSNYVTSGLTATFNTTFTGTGAPDKWGTGTAVYNTPSAVSGTAYFTLNQGTIAIGNNTALGSNQFIMGDPTGANVVTFKSAGLSAYVISNYVIVDATNFILDTGGNLTFGGPINLGTTARTATVNNSSFFSGALTNTAGLTKAGTGTLTFSGTTINTYGATIVSAGTLVLGKTIVNGAIPVAGVTVKSGGTLQSGAANQINDGAPMTLAGGTWLTGGYGEQLGTLKLTASSTINLGGSGVVKFAASSGVAWTGSTELNIASWNGWAGGGGPSQLFAGANSSGLTASQLSQIQFVNPLGLSGNFAAKTLSSGEIVPVFSPPSFGGQPQPQVAVAGANVTFTATVNGTSPLGYQWTFNRGGIAGATNSTVTLTNVATNQTGAYAIMVTNIVGTNSSNPALLTVYATAAAAIGLVSAPANGHFSFGISGVPGYNYVIQSSTDLLNWFPLATNPSPFTFTDSNAVNPSEFYRAFHSP